MIGICLGMQYLVMFESVKGSDIQEYHISLNENRDLDFVQNPKENTWSFANHSWQELKSLATEKLSYNSHWFGFEPDVLAEDFGFINTFKYTASSDDFLGVDFVTNIEGIEFPFMGTVYHVEK